MFEKQSCFNCIHFNICKVMNFFEKNIIIDTNSNEYKNNFNLLYNTLSKVCKFYLIKEQNNE